jgi:RNA polymerase sigma factor (sigma-70 family)
MQQQRAATPDLVRLFDAGTATSLSEWELLERFTSRGDELAFEALVARLGPMVLGTCRRMLGHPSDADDAFQATFLVLLRRARTLGPSDAIGAWLHGVAVRVATRARSDAARRGRRERLGVAVESIGAPADATAPEIRRILDDEIDRLPHKYRAPIIMCYLEGRTHEEAARLLGWPIGSVKGRLARARSLLESRLSRRGLASSAGALVAAMASATGAEAAVPAPLLQATCRAAAQLSAGKLSGLVLSTSVAGLLRGALSAMMLEKLRMTVLTIAVSGAALTGAAVMARQHADKPTEGRPEERTPVALAKDVSRVQQDVFGPTVRPQPRQNPVPTSAEDLYRELVEAARGSYLASADEVRAGRGPLLRVYQASRQLLEAQREAAKTSEEKARAVAEHIDRIRTLESRFEIGSTDRAEAAAILAEAQLWLAQAKEPRKEVHETAKEAPSKPTSPAPAPGSKPGQDARSLAVLEKLEQPVAMSFPNETPLEDVLKYIKQATQGPNDAGIPIYVDPQGLADADRTMTSPITIDLERIPLRRSLQLLLHQLGLVYFVDDGILCITSQDSGSSAFVPTNLGPSPLQEKLLKADRGELAVAEMKELIEILKLQRELEMAQSRSESPGGLHAKAGDEAKQLEPLIKELRELIGVLRSEREKTAGNKPH